MMATMKLISSTPEAYHTNHFYRGDVGAMLPPKICYNQSINIFIANSKLSIIIYYTAKNRAPKFSAGLLQILCWEPGGLPSFKVSGDPCNRIEFPRQSVWALWQIVPDGEQGFSLTTAISSGVSVLPWTDPLLHNRIEFPANLYGLCGK